MARTIIAKEAYGYFIMSSLAVIIACIGLFIIFLEREKPTEQRSAGKIILGICISGAGSFLMLLTIMFLLSRQR